MSKQSNSLYVLVPAAMMAASPLSAAEVQIQASGPVIELTISEEVKAQPDIATVSAGVSSEAKTAVEAMQINAREMASVIARIKALGIDAKDIQTNGISLNASYDYNQQSQRPEFLGYVASNQVSVILRDVARTGAVLDALVAAGATNIGGPSFGIGDDTAAKAQARKAAMESARTRAMEYAGWAGYSGIRLLEVSESVMAFSPQPMLRAMAADSVSATPIEPGMVGTGVTITVKYEMTR